RRSTRSTTSRARPARDSGGILRRLAAGDLPLVLAWRNHPDGRRFMYTRHEISAEEHARWFAEAEADPSRHLLVFAEKPAEKPAAPPVPRGFVPRGFVHFSAHFRVVAPGTGADWGFYLAPDAPRGTGRRLGEAALRHAFETAGFHKVCGQVLGFNERSLRFHQNLGFAREGVLREQHFDGTAYHD